MNGGEDVHQPKAAGLCLQLQPIKNTVSNTIPHNPVQHSNLFPTKYNTINTVNRICLISVLLSTLNQVTSSDRSPLSIELMTAVMYFT